MPHLPSGGRHSSLSGRGGSMGASLGRGRRSSSLPDLPPSEFELSEARFRGRVSDGYDEDYPGSGRGRRASLSASYSSGTHRLLELLSARQPRTPARDPHAPSPVWWTRTPPSPLQCRCLRCRQPSSASRATSCCRATRAAASAPPPSVRHHYSHTIARHAIPPHLDAPRHHCPASAGASAAPLPRLCRAHPMRSPLLPPSLGGRPPAHPRLRPPREPHTDGSQGTDRHQAGTTTHSRPHPRPHPHVTHDHTTHPHPTHTLHMAPSLVQTSS